MHLFLTSVLPFLAHNHPSAAAFLTCRHHNFHASIIPEFLSNEGRVELFCQARQQNQLEADSEAQYINLFNLFIQTPLMQFSPSLVLPQKDSAKSILNRLLKTKYFARTLQRCSFGSEVKIRKNGLLRDLSKVQSLTNLDSLDFKINNEQLEIIINSFLNLETLTIGYGARLEAFSTPEVLTMQNLHLLRMGNSDDSRPAIKLSSPPPRATKTLRSLTIQKVYPWFATEFVPHFPNLRTLVLSGPSYDPDQLDLRPLSASLPLLINLSLERYKLKNSESLKNLVHLSSLEFHHCRMNTLSEHHESILRLVLPEHRSSSPMSDLSFLAQGSLPQLTTLCFDSCSGVSTSSFASLVHAPNLRVLELSVGNFDNAGLSYLDNMIHLRKLDLSWTQIAGHSRLLKTLMQNSFQLEELNLGWCHRIGNQGAIAGALYSTHSRLRVLNLGDCNLVDDDLNGIGALKNSLEVLHLSENGNLTNTALMHCKGLVNLKRLRLCNCHRIEDLSPLKDCLNLEELDVWGCRINKS